jgi:SAM-dependent methyltransferase
MTTALANFTADTALPSDSDLWLRCPGCSASIGAISDRDDGLLSAKIECDDCGHQIIRTNGVWRMLSRRQHLSVSGFVRDYEEIRRAEGRGSSHPAFYLALPFADLTGNFRDQWRIRGRSYRFFEQHLLPVLEARYGDSFRVLDIGAGNCWLSYRLALRGHRPVAVDLCSNAYDGLEAASHYASVLPKFFARMEAEMNCLPFEEDQFDVAIYNASFHYSTNYEKTLREALRCLRPRGTILIIDSPTYQQARSGESMRSERRRLFSARFGTGGDSLPTSDYLTPAIMDDLAALGIRWTRHLASYGVRWWLRPALARLRRRREPSQFYIYEGQTVIS